MPDSTTWSEARTIRDLIMPSLRKSGWSEQSWRREYPITDPGLSVIDGRVRRSAPLRADFALLHGERPVAVVEAKRTRRDVRVGVQQARRYADRLDVPLAYATNGRRIIEINMVAQTEREVTKFHEPTAVWDLYRGAHQLDNDLAVAFAETPYNRRVLDGVGNPKTLRYYQDVAVQRLLRGIARGDQRLLAVLATGAGKTNVAMQLVHVLWENRWPRGVGSDDSRPRVLYLADRDVLVTQPMRDWFRPAFGEEPVGRIRGAVSRSKHLYFALYQSLDQAGEDRDALFQEYDDDWFDLVIVDECHRGSASEDSAWRDVLHHFNKAVQVGLTATPVARSDADTYGYFGAPAVEYSLRQGIEDGFLAPFQVVRVHLDSDVDGVDVPVGTQDIVDGRPVPAGTWQPPQLDRELIVLGRARAAAEYVTEFLRRTDRMGKTIVFCEDQGHAFRVREELLKLNRDLMQMHRDWVVRITADEGDLGKALLERFQQPDEPSPVVVTTSQLLSTGVDVPTVKNIVLFRRIRSMPHFKQIIGRGTRLDPEHGKEYFTIIDFLGSTRLFEDSEFDGPPVRRTEVPPGEELPELDLNPIENSGDPTGPEDDVVAEPEAEFTHTDGGDTTEGDDHVDDPHQIDDIERRSRPYTIDGIDVRVASEAVYVVDAGTGTLRRVRYEQWVRDRMRALDERPDSLLAQWATVRGRRVLRERLEEELAIGIDDFARRLNKPDCDPIDLLINLAWDQPLTTRRQRVERFNNQEWDFLRRFAPEARRVLAALVEKYAANGPDDLSAQVLVMPPFTHMGSPAQIARTFGGTETLHSAIDELGARVFATV